MNRISSYFIDHCRVFFTTLGRLCRTPFSSLMIILVLGVSLALPLSFYVFLEGVQAIGHYWDKSNQISIFLKQDVGQQERKTLTKTLESMTAVETVEFISKEKGLVSFGQFSGFGDLLKAYGENPLPDVLAITPHPAFSASGLEGLVLEFNQLPGVDYVQLDLAWVKRLQAIINIVERVLIILSFLLAMAVLLVVSNTIRLIIHQRHAEIRVIKLVGGTDAFIRRPFLYLGFWYGLGGAAIAWLLVKLALELIHNPLKSLYEAYSSDLILSGLSLTELAACFAVSIILSIIGAVIAVNRQLATIEPV